jgi:hypothetical protein
MARSSHANVRARKLATASYIGAGVVSPGGDGDLNRYMLGVPRVRALSGFAPANLYMAPTGLNFFAPRLQLSNPWASDEIVMRFAGAQMTEGGNAPQETTFANAAITIPRCW